MRPVEPLRKINFSYLCFSACFCIIYLKVLPFLLFQTQIQTQIVPGPQPPIQIKTRIINIENLFSSFVDGFCNRCNPTSPACSNNFLKLSKNPYTKFTAQNITKNQNNITQIKSIIQSVNGSYQFPSQKNLNNITTKYVINLPLNVNKIKGVILYFHPTNLGTLQTPTAQNTQTSAISALYTSNNYAVIFINYLGFEFADFYPHPYLLYPRQIGKSAILSLNSALKDIKQQYKSMQKFSLFLVGFGQGASYALWLEKCLQLQTICQGAKLDIAYEYKGAAGLSGPYDLVNTFKPFLTQKVKKDNNNPYKIETQQITNFVKPIKLVTTLISYLYYNKGKTNYDEEMHADFWVMKCDRFIPNKNCEIGNNTYQNILQAIKSRKSLLEIAQSISYSAFGKEFNNQKKQKYLGSFKPKYMRGDRNSVYGLASERLLDQKDFNDALQDASAINNEPNKKVFLFSLKRDSIFSVNSTENFESKYRSKVEAYYFDNKQCQVCQNQGGSLVPVDHNNAQILSNIFALAFIKNIS